MHKAARRISEKSKVPGFRPGKAPYPVVLRMYGDEAVRDQAIEILVDDKYPAILDEAKIEASGSGKLEDIHQHRSTEILLHHSTGTRCYRWRL